MSGSRAYLLPIGVFAALAVIFGLYLWQVGSGQKSISEIPSVLIDRPAPTFALPPIDGTGPGFASTDLAGKVALVNIWASWCPPCREEHPLLMRLAKEGVPLYGINYKDKPADARRFLGDLGNPFRRIGADRVGRVAIDWGVYGYPETFVVDQSGRIRYRHVGPVLPQQMDEMISLVEDLR